jgi:LysR family hydrogen peroxide-inducible transcriptional activator
VVLRPIEAPLGQVTGRTLGLAWRARSPRAPEFRSLAPVIGEAIAAAVA